MSHRREGKKRQVSVSVFTLLAQSRLILFFLFFVRMKKNSIRDNGIPTGAFGGLSSLNGMRWDHDKDGRGGSKGRKSGKEQAEYTRDWLELVGKSRWRRYCADGCDEPLPRTKFM